MSSSLCSVTIWAFYKVTICLLEEVLPRWMAEVGANAALHVDTLGFSSKDCVKPTDLSSCIG